MPPAPLKTRAGPPRGRPLLAPPEVDGSLLRCYTCGGIATVTGASDPLADRGAWPKLPCPVTAGCPGYLVPEALN